MEITKLQANIPELEKFLTFVHSDKNEKDITEHMISQLSAKGYASESLNRLDHEFLREMYLNTFLLKD